MSAESIDFERALRTQLRQRAAAATPPPDAYARFVTVRSTGAGRPTTEASDGDDWVEPAGFELRSSERRENRPGTWLLLGAVAACVVAFLIAIGSAGDEDDETSAADGERVDYALSVMDDYFARFEDGDLDGIMALFAPDAEFSDRQNARTRDQFEAVTAWDIAQGSTNVSPRCTADDPIDVAVTVRCVFGNHQYIARIVGAPPVEVTLTATITPDGITNLGTDYDQRGYTAVNAPFSRWIIETHPEALVATNCCGGTTAEHSQLNGRMRARYADEWAAHLQANGCTYEFDCSTTTTAVD